MSQVSINPDSVDQLAARINGQHVVIDEALANLRGINAELDAVWDGQAQITFHGTYGDWITQLERYSETLTNVQNYLRSVAQNFRELDQAAAQAASGATMAE
jgi:WXG100 family type VII secretion target